MLSVYVSQFVDVLLFLHTYGRKDEPTEIAFGESDIGTLHLKSYKWNSFR